MLYTQFSNAINIQNILYGGKKSKVDNLPFKGMSQYLKIDPEEFLKGYFSLSSTTTTQGLNNWGRILGVDRTIRIPSIVEQSIFGFDTGNTPMPIDTGYPQNFDNGNFYGGQENLYRMNDQQFLFLLKLRYAVLNTNCTLESANIILNTYFIAENPSQSVIVGDITSEVKMYISVISPIPVYQIYILRFRPDVLPIPAGVAYQVSATPLITP